MLTPETAALVAADGKFNPAVFEERSGVGISAQRAKQLATAFLRTHGEGFRPMLEEDHQGPVAIASLRQCGRTYLAESPYELSADLPILLQRVFGSWWLVSFCNGNERQVSIAVALRSEALDVSPQGLLVYPPEMSAYFYPLGIPRTLGELPVEPERAVSAVASVGGRRINRIPRLVAPAVGSFPQFARWEASTEAATNVEVIQAGGARAARTASTLYHGVELFIKPPSSYLAAPSQPASTDYRYSVREGGRFRQVSVAVRRIPAIPVAFEPIANGGR